MDKTYLINLAVFVGILVIAFFLYQKFVPLKEEEKAPELETQGLEIEVLAEGEGREAQIGDKVTVHYTGNLEDSTKFDSSLDREEPFSFTLGENRVIQGWEKGVLGMKKGEKRKLVISPELGYGEAGTPGGPIPPNAVLIFEIELLEIE